jgi:hypothetical protein
MERFESQSPKTIWNKVEEIGKVVALSALVALLGAENALAKDKHQSPEKTKIKIEQLKSKIAEQEKAIEKISDEKGKAHALTINGIQAKELKTKTGDIIMVIHNPSGKISISLQTANGVLTYFDRNADGRVDTVVVDNNEAKSKIAGDSQKMEDAMDAYSDIDSVAQRANVEADLEPKAKAVHEFSETNGKHSVRTVDFKTGGKTVLHGDAAAELTSHIEDSFSFFLGNVEK